MWTCPVCPSAHGVPVLKGPCRACSRGQRGSGRAGPGRPRSGWRRRQASPAQAALPPARRVPTQASARGFSPEPLPWPSVGSAFSPHSGPGSAVTPLPLSPASFVRGLWDAPPRGSLGVLVTCELRGGRVCLGHGRFRSVCGAPARGLRVLCHPAPGTEKCEACKWVRGSRCGPARVSRPTSCALQWP